MNCAQRFETHSEEETLELGRKIAPLLPENGLVLLVGELGSGKTTLTKGIVEGRGAACSEDVSSPTFTLIHEYGNPVRVYHVDLYRVDSLEQARRLGLEDLFEEPALIVIEWGDRFPELLPRDHVTIRLYHADEYQRIVELSSHR
jgi:tRNA threonylcarbamoyladenosine biosynthesis protein TsaE